MSFFLINTRPQKHQLEYAVKGIIGVLWVNGGGGGGGGGGGWWWWWW